MVLFSMTILIAKTKHASDAQYEYTIVPGAYLNSTTYGSKIFYFEDEKSCKIWRGNFVEAARPAFSKHINIYHSRDYISLDNMLTYKFVGTGTFKTYDKAGKYMATRLVEEKKN